MRKWLIIVPNLDRVDKHQLDLAQYMEKNKYTLVLYELKQLFPLIVADRNMKLNIFKKNNFFRTNEIIEFL
jgi:beta-1,4-N-acetylglucosaminyltransferase